MGKMSDLAIEYAEAYCELHGLDQSKDEDWEKAMDWVIHCGMDYREMNTYLRREIAKLY